MKFALIVFLVVAVLVAMVVPSSAVLASPPKEYVVTFILAESKMDKGWNMAHDRGANKLRNLGKVIDEWDLGFVVKLAGTEYDTLRVHFVTGAGYGSKIAGVMQKALETQKPNMIFGTWFNSYQATQELAPEYPKVIFNHCSSYPLMKSSDFETKNVGTYFVKQCLSDHAIGQIAGREGHNKIGFVSTFAIPEPIRAVNAFTLGLQKGLRDAGYDDTVEVNVIWIDSWLNPEKEYQAAQALIDMGYPVIRQLPDTPTTSVVACKNGAVALGYGTDVSEDAPCALATNEWAWGDYYLACVLAGLNGDWKPHDWFEPGSKIIYDGDIPQVNHADAWSGPISGFGWDTNGDEYKVFVPEGETLTDMDILTMHWFVDGVITGARPSTPVENMSQFATD